MERTLANTWSAQDKRGVETSLVQYALRELRTRIAQHEAAWADEDPAVGGGAQLPAGAGERGEEAEEAALWRLARKIPMGHALCLTFLNVKASRRLCLCLMWRALDLAATRTCAVPAPSSLLARPHACPTGRQQGAADAALAARRLARLRRAPAAAGRRGGSVLAPCGGRCSAAQGGRGSRRAGAGRRREPLVPHV